ncbi:MAG: PepSY domain-containing protein [Acidimicrobiales bacterium]|nr:PepSY domain-containing protein [Acidimicrobiales bacterium]
MNRTRKIVIGAVAAVAIAGGVGAGVAVAGSSDDAEAPITGPALDQATAAALAHTGGGRVTETEVGDEDSYYEVEVTLDDRSQVDVQLDEDFQVVGANADVEDPADAD